MTDRPPLEWIIEVCVICGCQLGPGIGSRTSTGRCVEKAHHHHGATIVRVAALPDDEQEPASVRHLGFLRHWRIPFPGSHYPDSAVRGSGD